MFTKLIKIKKFIGDEVWNYFLASAFIGLFWFAIECSFIFIIQGFLFSIGLHTESNSFLPSWYPTSLGASISILILFGVLRSSVYMLKAHFASLTQVSFSCRQRINILTFGLKNSHLVSTKEILSIFSEVTSQSGVVMNNASMLISTVIAATFFFIAGLRLAPIEMIIGVTALFVFLMPLKFTTRKVNSYGRAIVQEWETLNESLMRGLKNNFFLSIYNQVDAEIASGDQKLNNYKHHYSKYSVIAGFATAFPLFLGVFILSLITFMSVKLIHTDPIKLISFFYIFIRLAQAASEASGTVTNLKFHFPGFKILYDWGMRFEEFNNQKTKQLKIIDSEEVIIELKNIEFHYSKNKPIFTDLNFKIKTADVLLIKGESGVGKSTLLSLILGVQNPTGGEVIINSYSTNDLILDLHKVLAYVGPEPYLIQGSIRENLTYGLDNKNIIQDKELWSALELMELGELIRSLPLQLDEQLADVAQLSTGQKQRLSFARAIVRKPKLLVLDEATANLDILTERKIIANLKDVFKNCTCIIVTHKESFDSLGTHVMNLVKNQGDKVLC